MPFDLILRRFLPRTKLLMHLNDRYEFGMSGYDHVMNPPCLSGCFMFLRLATLAAHNLFFDDGYFMYCEDFDLIRRIHRVAGTLHYPQRDNTPRINRIALCVNPRAWNDRSSAL